jgi:hypothetical protein
MKANEMGIACSTEVGKVECVQSLMGKHEGKRSLGIPRRTFEGNIKTGTEGTQCDVVECIKLAQDTN